MPKERSRLALRLAGLRLVRSIYAGWRLTPYPAYVPSHRLTPPGPRKRSTAGQLAHPPSVHRQAQGQILRIGVKIVLRLQVAIRIL
ncbi:hypothetical protein, partial [Klebsiella sp. 20_CIP_Kleb]|uniref:hypothetical protein n=1 Tax=Klebsiella sp. 20_CIP_Kleb TaxID=3391444 RepID=UPI003D177B0B